MTVADRQRNARPVVASKKVASDNPEPVPSTDRIVEAAIHLFATKGLSCSLEEVAAMAGFTKGAVYYYFKSKELLMLAVLSAIEARSIDATAVQLKAHDGSASDRLADFVRLQTRWAAAYPEDLAIMILLSIETAKARSKVRAHVLRIYNKLGATLEAILEDGKRSGEFARALDVKDTVLYLLAVHDGNMMIWYRSGTDPKIGRKLAIATLKGFSHAVMETS